MPFVFQDTYIINLYHVDTVFIVIINKLEEDFRNSKETRGFEIKIKLKISNFIPKSFLFCITLQHLLL